MKLEFVEHMAMSGAHVCPVSQQIRDDARQKPTIESMSVWYLTDCPSTAKKPPAPVTPYATDPMMIPTVKQAVRERPGYIDSHCRSSQSLRQSAVPPSQTQRW